MTDRQTIQVTINSLHYLTYLTKSLKLLNIIIKLERVMVLADNESSQCTLSL
jgi:hypothetical protein